MPVEPLAPARPLEGLLVLDFAQFLAGPMAALRLGDMGARVVKVERPGSGELGRELYLSDQRIDGMSGLFQTVNRGKESLTADLKDPADVARILALVAQADVLVENFRPGVMERLGLGAEHLRERNPGLVYASVTGYGPDGPWRGLPGQDLLVQARSGLMWLNGRAGEPPTPAGLSLVDIYTGSVLVQGILAALVRRGITGQGARVETSLLEAAADLQTEQLTVFLNDGGVEPSRDDVASAHPNLTAPYGVYPTADGWLAVAMNPLPRLGALLDLPALADAAAGTFTRRSATKATVAARLAERTTQAWLDVLEPAGIWCAEVLDWSRLVAHDVWGALGLEQSVRTTGDRTFRTTRCPLRIDGRVLTDDRAAPRLGQHDEVPLVAAATTGADA